MNPNHVPPYGQPIPMQPPQRRHDGSYTQVPPHMRSHPGYQPYYPQHMGPMMPQYPQHYAPNWYPYQQQHMHPMHQARPHYYPQSPQYPQHHGPMQQPLHPQPSPRPLHTPTQPVQLPAPSSASTSSTAPVQTPPSPPLSTSTTVSVRKDIPSNTASPGPQRVQSPQVVASSDAERFFPPTPWLSVEGGTFPPRAPRQRRQILRSQLANEPITYPLIEPVSIPEDHSHIPPETITPKAETLVDQKDREVEAEQHLADTPTPQTSDAPSDTISTQPTTPSSSAPVPTPKSQETPTQTKSRPVLPILPAMPILPPSPSAARKTHRDSVISSHSKTSEDAIPANETRRPSSSVAAEEPGGHKLVEAPPPVKPTSWANLFRSNQQPSVPTVRSSSVGSSNGVLAPKGETLSEVLNDVNAPIEPPSKVSFLQPRGLVNTGNMCYMNSVLQVLVFCIPFYDFLSKISRRAAHTFKSDTPLIDAIILFVQEYQALDTATSPEQLRLRLRPDDYENYGEPFIPEYVYAAIKQLPRFKEMRRGHQQDAQEFLGFLLEELHEECSRAMRPGTGSSSGRSTPLGSAPSVSDQVDNESGWMEVGHKQRPAVTRSSGASLVDSPVTSIFGGKLRSELKVTGNKLSVTLEPYSPLQLDIGSPEVSNIIDALKGLTRAEAMQGEFQSAKGHQSKATKQVFIETLPPVLILHLKRFHYDSTTKRAEKIWKKVGYPLDLEIPKEVFPTSVRNKYSAHGGLPKYRLTGVIYHHGKYANGGHYTVDIRRQDGKEWIRLDDTLIRRIRNEDVAEGGSEEDPKVLAAALERHKQGKPATNRFEQIEQDEEDEVESEKVWSHVNGHSRSKSSASAMLNGAATPAKTSAPQTPREKTSVKENKVAYLLFYQRVGS